MNFKKLALAISLTAAFCYMGCEDSSTEPKAGEDDQPTLSSESNGGDENVESSESTGGEPGDKTVTSSESNGGEGGASAESSGDTAPESSSSVGSFEFPIDTTGYADMMKCDEEGATREQYGMTQTCKDGMWSVDSSSYADMLKCDEDGQTREQMGMVFVCKGGQWTMDSTATAEANKCDEEGATKTESMEMGTMSMDFTYTCKDGKWEMEMPDFGGMFGGDSTGNFNWGDSSFTMPGGGSWNMGDSSAFGGGNFGGGNFGGGAGAE